MSDQPAPLIDPYRHEHEADLISSLLLGRQTADNAANYADRLIILINIQGNIQGLASHEDLLGEDQQSPGADIDGFRDLSFGR